MDNGIFKVHMDINACDCTWGCLDIVRESAQKVDSGWKPVLHLGIEPTSAARRSHSTNWATSPLPCNTCWVLLFTVVSRFSVCAGSSCGSYLCAVFMCVCCFVLLWVFFVFLGGWMGREMEGREGFLCFVVACFVLGCWRDWLTDWTFITQG